MFPIHHLDHFVFEMWLIGLITIGLIGLIVNYCINMLVLIIEF